jgi:hypothetical protein
MASRFRFAPYDEPADVKVENLEELNRIRSLYNARLDSTLPVEMFAEEFLRAMGKILMGSPLEHLELTHVEFETGSFDDHDGKDDA